LGSIQTANVEVFLTTNDQKKHTFYVMVEAKGGASQWVGPYDLKIGCGTYVDLYLAQSIVLN
jgi:hypothetical protein